MSPEQQKLQSPTSSAEIRSDIDRIKDRVAQLRIKAEQRKVGSNISAPAQEHQLTTMPPFTGLTPHTIGVRLNNETDNPVLDRKEELGSSADTREQTPVTGVQDSVAELREAAILTTQEENNTESTSDESSQQCPICSGTLLRNYDPDDDDCATSTGLHCCPQACPATANTCSFALPFQEMINDIVRTNKKGRESATPDAQKKSEQKESRIKDGGHLYCVICQAYIIKDEDDQKKHINEKERRIAQLECQRIEQIKQVEAQLKREMDELESRHKIRITEMQNRQTNLEADLSTHTKRLRDLELQHKEVTGIKENQEKEIEELLAKLYSGEQLRRKLHNRLQEIRGNIRVFVRTRPFISQDGVNIRKNSPIDVSLDNETVSICDARTKKAHDFKFDRVFPPSAQQQEVFDEVSDFVQSALDGYNVCLFSYGQTGSGKTFTMQGDGDGAMRGIIPRAVEKILSQVKALEGERWQYTMSASFLEIYNEELKDLLYSASQGCTELAIKRNKDGQSYVENLTKFNIDTKDSEKGMMQLNALMKEAAHSRSVASTNMSRESSRSHAIFGLHLHGFNESTGTIVSGVLNLCDLAGSERLDRSGTGSDVTRLRETQAINKSLSSLGTVFNALATGASHVPYRNSKLTYLLQDCLSGDGKALMFVNLSPTLRSGGESLCSLRFAKQVHQVSFGKLSRNVEYVGKK